MAVLLALVSSLLWGTGDFLGGTLSRRIPALVVVGWSQAAGLVLAMGVIVGTGATQPWAAVAPYAVGAAILGTAGLLMFYVALARGTMGVVAPITALGAVVPLVVGLVRGEQPTVIQGVGLAVALVGVVLASGPELSGGAGAVPIALAGGAALAFGVTLTVIAWGAERSALATVAGMRAFTTVVAAVALVALILRGRQRMVAVPRPLVPAVVAVGVFDVTANLTFGVAATLGLLTLVSVAGSLYPVMTVLLARLIHRERLARIQVLGVSGALAGVVLIAAG